MEESPEQVLARLARHRDSLIRARQQPDPGEHRPPTPVPPAVAGTRAAAEFIPPSPSSGEHGWRLTHSAVLLTLLGLVLSVVAAVIAVLAFVRFDAVTAFGIVGVMVVLGLIAAVRRVPVALWWTVGAVLGGLLGRWS